MIDMRLKKPEKKFFFKDTFLKYDHSHIDDSKIEQKVFGMTRTYKEYLKEKNRIDLLSKLTTLRTKIEKTHDSIDISEYLYYSKIYYTKYSK